MTNPTMNALVWCELPVSDLNKAIEFFNAVFDYNLEPTDQMGPQLVAVLPSEKGAASGHLYQTDQPTTGGATLHLQISDTIEAALERVKAAGGTVLDMPPIPIPQGRFAYIQDPDGNSLGLFEANT